MTTFTVVEETPTEEVVTQAEEKLFIAGLPIVYKMGAYQESELATYNYQYNYGDRHNITLADGKETLARADEITPSRSLTDSEMIHYLTEELVKASESADHYRKLYSQSQDDIQTISDALAEEAENRGWCSEYNQFCEEVNSKLRAGTYLTPLEQEYAVTVRIKAEVEIERTIYVTTTSQEDAEYLVQDDPESYFEPEEVALEHVKNHGFDNYDVESV